MGAMKTKIAAGLLGALVLAAGCVRTVNDRHHFALSPGRDKFESRYERTVEQVYSASTAVLRRNGTIGRESIINTTTNQVRAIEGQINNRNVFVRVEPVDPVVTSVKVQVRSKGGGTDLTLTQEIKKQIAIELATR